MLWLVRPVIQLRWYQGTRADQGADPAVRAVLGRALDSSSCWAVDTTLATMLRCSHRTRAPFGGCKQTSNRRPAAPRRSVQSNAIQIAGALQPQFAAAQEGMFQCTHINVLCRTRGLHLRGGSVPMSKAAASPPSGASKAADSPTVHSQHAATSQLHNTSNAWCAAAHQSVCATHSIHGCCCCCCCCRCLRPRGTAC
jgi:hypothetical protein